MDFGKAQFLFRKGLLDFLCLMVFMPMADTHKRNSDEQQQAVDKSELFR